MLYMEHTWTKFVRLLTPLRCAGLLPSLGVTGETQVADHLIAEKPVALPEDRPTRRSLKIKQLDAKMVRAIATVNVRHLGRGPRKRSR